MKSGYLSLFYSIGEKPLEYWNKQYSRTGSIKRVLDEELNENVKKSHYFCSLLIFIL